ncbi:hypothetical protein SAMN05444166_5317 [Singulisphaera sp. GP187]|nr:hypothetical protein SAMN05444166_5317 [Singulisphaera sp. GP187]
MGFIPKLSELFVWLLEDQRRSEAEYKANYLPMVDELQDSKLGKFI